MTQLSQDALTSHAVFAHYTQQQFYRNHLQIPSKHTAFIYPTMTMLRCPKALYGMSSVYLKRGEIFMFGGIEPTKREVDGVSSVERKYQNAVHLYYNTFAPNRIQKGHFMEMGKWVTIEEKKDEDVGHNCDLNDNDNDTIFPSKRAFSVAQYIPDSKVYIYGGEDEYKQPLNDMWCFDVTKKCWYIVGDGPIPLSLSASVVHFDTKYSDEDSVTYFLSERCKEDESDSIARLDLVLKDYQSFMKDPYAIRHLPDAPNVDTSHDIFIVIYGGKTLGGKCVDHTYAYSLTQKEWKKLPPGPPPRRGHTMTYRNGKMYIYGGYSDVKIFHNEIWEYDIKKAMSDEDDYLRKIEPVSSRNPEGRTGHSSLLMGNQMLIFGGNTGGSTKNDMWAFDLLKLEWKEIKLSKSIHGRWYQSLIFASDSQIALIGGANSAMSKAIQNVELLHISIGDIDIHMSRITGETEGSDLDEYDDLLDDPDLDYIE